MSLIPSGRDDRLTWFESRIDAWALDPASVGLTSEGVDSLRAQILQARADHAAAQIARDTAKSATARAEESLAAMTSPGRATVATIKSFALLSRDPGVYTRARIDPPAQAAPIPAPETPTSITGTLSATGEVKLTWKARRSGPSTGVFFTIARMNAGERDFTTLGATPGTTFTDEQANVRDGPVAYRVMARRGRLESEWTVPVLFTLGARGAVRAGVRDGPALPVARAA